MTTKCVTTLTILTLDDDPQYVSDSLANHCEIEGWELVDMDGRIEPMENDEEV